MSNSGEQEQEWLAALLTVPASEEVEAVIRARQARISCADIDVEISTD